MKVEINIDCETEREIFLHLSVIREQLRKKFKKLTPHGRPLNCEVEDSNCYGDHTVKVVDDL